MVELAEVGGAEKVSCSDIGLHRRSLRTPNEPTESSSASQPTGAEIVGVPTLGLLGSSELY